MKVSDLYRRLVDKGLTLSTEDGSNILIRPASQLTDEDRRLIRDNKASLLNVLARSSKRNPQKEQSPRQRRPRPGADLGFHWHDEEIVVRRYRPDMGQVYSQRFALDCETEMVEFPEIPELALVAVSDGEAHFLIHPDDLGGFVMAHPNARIVFHNVAFDFWVVHQHLEANEEQQALTTWRKLARQRRFHDTMLLDMLLAIARGESAEVRRRDLGIVAQTYAGLELDKDDPFRTRYAELLGVDWANVDPGFFQYAIKDVIATIRAYSSMRTMAQRVMEEAGFDTESKEQFSIRSDAIRRFGMLSEAIQVQAAIALDAISRNGMTTDRKALTRVKRKYEQMLEKDIKTLNRDFPGLFKTSKEGQLQRTKKSGVPSKSTKALDGFLLQAAKEIEEETETPIPIPRTPKGQVAKSMDLWEPLSGQHPFLKIWVQYEHAAKLSQFPAKLDSPIVRPRYNVLTRTGRTGCSSPNIQQIPRDDAFRHVIVPSPGNLLLIVDYKFIELVTLAAVCLSRFGASRLAEVIREGIDPHCYTAALLKGMKYRQFTRLKKGKPEEFKSWRQMAKPVNFGVPGGMGPKSLREYAQKTYGVRMSLEEAEEFHRRLVEDVYPELKLYLRDKSMETLARNLQTSPGELWARLDRHGSRSAALVGGMRRITAGNLWKADGTPYNEGYVERVWDSLIEANHNAAFEKELANRSGKDTLSAQLFFTRVPTLTGRVRGGVTYTSERNTQFQGLAADGSKLALARLVLAGYRVVGFVHDEVLVELPDEGGYVSRSVVADVVGHLAKGMEEVTAGVPVECEYTLATCWSKGAKLMEDDDRVYPWSPGK